ncbi:hypothetical protein ACLK2D_06295 [Escherichia coli]
MFNAVPSIAISLRPLMFARWVKSRWLTALAIASSCRHGCSDLARNQMIVNTSKSAINTAITRWTSTTVSMRISVVRSKLRYQLIKPGNKLADIR